MSELVIRESNLPAASLEELARTAVHEHEEALAAGSAMVEHAIRAGLALLEAKKLVPRGEWQDWLVANFPYSLSVPNVYMRLATYQEVVRAGSPPTLKAARRLLSGLDSRSMNWHRHGFEPEEEAKMIERARALRRQPGRGTRKTRGMDGSFMTYRDIAAEMEIPVHWVARWLDPKAHQRTKERQKRLQKNVRAAAARDKRQQDVKRAGGGLAEAYSLVRRALQVLDKTETVTPRGKGLKSEAIHRLHDAEERIGWAAKAETIGG